MQRRGWSTVLRLATGAMLIATAVSSCGTQPDPATDAALPITVAPLGAAQDFGYYAARDQGYFDDEGVEVTSIELETRVLARDAVSSGAVDAGHVSLNTALPAIEKGEPIRVVSGVSSSFPLVAIVSSKFLDSSGLSAQQWEQLSPQDRLERLGGKTIGVPAPGDLNDQVIRAELRALSEREPDELLTFQYLQSDAAIESTYEAGRLDAIVVDAGTANWFVKNRGSAAFLTLDEQKEFTPGAVIPGGQFVANTEWAAENENNAEALRRFFRAYQRGNAWVAELTDEEFTEWVVGNHPDVTDPDALDRLVEGAIVHRDLTILDGRLSDESLATGVEFATEQGTISSPVAVADTFTWDYLPPATGSGQP